MTAAVLVLFVVGAFFLLLTLRRGRPRAPEPPEVAIEPPSAPAPMRVMAMRCHGFVRIIDASGEREVALPASPLEHGEFPTAIGGPPSGEVYVVGKLYTGKPGPDHGVVYQLQPGGSFGIVHTMPDKTFHSIGALAADDLFVGAVGGYVHFDGSRWQYVKLPFGSVAEIVIEEGRAYACSFDGGTWLELDGTTATPTAPRVQPDFPERSHTVGDTTYQYFDRSTEIGERTLSTEESAEIRAELAAVQRAVADGTARVRRLDTGD